MARETLWRRYREVRLGKAGSVDSASGRLVRAAQSSTVGTAAARFGLGSRVLVYLTLGVLVTQLAFGDRRANTDQGSGIQALGESAAGVVSLVLLVVGVGCYVLFRISVAMTSRQPRSGRTLAFVEGLAYLPFGYMAIGVLAGDDQAASQGPRYRGLSAQLMQTTPGRWLVGLVGAGVIVVGLFLASQGLRTTFMDALRLPGGAALARAVRIVGRIGSIGRGIVFTLAGALVVYAAIASKPAKTGGIDAAFETVRGAPFGRYVLLLAAIAFFSFALLTLAEAAWREISPPTSDAED